MDFNIRGRWKGLELLIKMIWVSTPYDKWFKNDLTKYEGVCELRNRVREGFRRMTQRRNKMIKRRNEDR